MTSVKTITKFLILRNMAVTGFLRQNWGVLPAVSLPRVRIWYGSGCTTIARAQHCGRASKQCEHGVRIFWKGRCVAGLAVPDVSKGGNAVIFKRQPTMTKALRSFETSRTAHSTAHRNLPRDSNLRKDRSENVITRDSAHTL